VRLTAALLQHRTDGDSVAAVRTAQAAEGDVGVAGVSLAVVGLTLEPPLARLPLAGASAAASGAPPDSGAVGSLASLAIRLSSMVTMGSRSACAFS
jgi:hypothetical protein